MKDLELIRVLEYVERTQRPYRALFPNAEEDPFWNVAAFLVRSHIRGEAVAVSLLADVAGIPYTTAVRRIEAWIGQGLIERRKQAGKRFTLHPSQDLLDRFMTYARHVKSLIAQTVGVRPTGEAEDDYYFGGAGHGAQLAPPPELVSALEGVGQFRVLAHDDTFFVSMQNLWADFRNRLGSRRDFDLRSLPDLHGRALSNARRPVSEYDIIVLNVPWLGEFAEGGLLRPAEPHVYRSGIDLLDFDPLVWSTGRWQGRQQAVPLFSSIEILAARKDWFDADERPYPKTFDDVLRAGRSYHAPAKGRYGIVWNAQAGMPIASSFAFILGCCGGAVLDLPREGDIWSLRAIDYGSVSVGLASDAARQALAYMRALLVISPPGVLDLAWDEALDLFMAGRAAMSYCWSMRAVRLESDVRSKVKGRVRYLPQPAGPRGRNICPLGGFLLAVPANLPEERVDAAFEAIRWMTSPESIRSQLATGFPVLPRFSVSADPETSGGSSLIPFVNDLARRSLLKTWQRPPLPCYSRVEAILGEEIHAALRGDKSDQAALAGAQARIEATLRALRGAGGGSPSSGASIM
jgi:multiple sugar transport system substrate-binding protein